MILRALYDYYQLHKGSMPAEGKELKEIGFIVVIDKDGNFLRFEDRRTADKKNADQFLVKKAVGRSSAPVANHLYDNAAYVLGYTDKENIDPVKYYSVFKSKIDSLKKNNPDNTDINALFKFFEQNIDKKLERFKGDPLWNEIVKNLNKKFSFFSFRIEGESDIIAEKDELIKLDIAEEPVGNKKGKKQKLFTCLITGEKTEPMAITTATMIPGSQAIAKLVAFQVNSGYDSYGKTKGENAPISPEAEFAYSTALKTLLGKNSRNKFLLGTRTFVFWGSSTDEATRQLENGLCNLFGFDSVTIDFEKESDPEAVKNIFLSVSNGKIPSASDDRFYILGLSPNSARIAVSYWADIPLKEFASNILDHFNDFTIIDTRKEKKPYSGVRSILSAVTLGGKSSDAIPSLPEAIGKSIFQNLPYPTMLYEACIRRIRAEQQIGITRAAIIKGYLNRLKNNNQKITEMLDTTNTNPGYLCGRLFAVIEKIQYDANKISSTRERYLNSASSTPVAVFPTLLNLSTHHIEKLNTGSAIYFENVKREIISKISADGFPDHLSLTDQGRFFVGYYHQMQEFYTKKSEKEI